MQEVFFLSFLNVKVAVCLFATLYLDNCKSCVTITDIESRSQNSYTAQCNSVSCHGSPIGSTQVLLTTHGKTNANKMRPRSARAVQRFTHIYLHTQTAVHTHLTNHDYFDRGKTQVLPIRSPYRYKDGTGCGMPCLYLWLQSRITVYF